MEGRRPRLQRATFPGSARSAAPKGDVPRKGNVLSRLVAADECKTATTATHRHRQVQPSTIANSTADAAGKRPVRKKAAPTLRPGSVYGGSQGCAPAAASAPSSPSPRGCSPRPPNPVPSGWAWRLFRSRSFPLVLSWLFSLLCCWSMAFPCSSSSLRRCSLAALGVSVARPASWLALGRSRLPAVAAAGSGAGSSSAALSARRPAAKTEHLVRPLGITPTLKKPAAVRRAAEAARLAEARRAANTRQRTEYGSTGGR